ncbi:hypothetical protein CTI12_AA458290 [Artemisia annua]|uniref:Uncharacterized protein n=1 Tax=Artemisia annua TaxID=35608 RepID=A0A2U1LK80_ARTAN|nr:hypothetical protein CTI12_AA458290 [Artemisia annua]
MLLYREGPLLLVACGRDTISIARSIRKLASENVFVVQQGYRGQGHEIKSFVLWNLPYKYERGVTTYPVVLGTQTHMQPTVNILLHSRMSHAKGNLVRARTLLHVRGPLEGLLIRIYL